MTYVKPFDLKKGYNYDMEYIEVIKELMETNNFSQQKLAEILNVHQTTVGQWLRGIKKPSYDNILMFYEKFGIEPNEFFGIK